MKKLALSLFLLILLLPRQTSAHVLVMDATKTRGAVLHVNPDDDPIAGQPALLFFDMQGQDSGYISLIVRSEIYEDIQLTLQKSGSLASAEYTFPSQGVYDLIFTVQSAGIAYEFRYAQRVSRGTLGGRLDRPDYSWAEILLLASGLSLILLAIVAVNRRNAIKLQSIL